MRARATSLFVVSTLLTSLSVGGSAIAAPHRGTEEIPADRVRSPPVAKRLPALFAPQTRDALSRALARGEISAGHYALERVRSLFDLAQIRARFGAVDRPDPRSATLLMRDLQIRLDQLSPADRAAG